LLKCQLITVAKEGAAYDDGELHPGFSRVVVGIRVTEERLVADNGVVGLSLRSTQALAKEIAPDVKYYAMEISMSLGYR
jgi:DNA-binding IclR family transcriptional regulator